MAHSEILVVAMFQRETTSTYSSIVVFSNMDERRRVSWVFIGATAFYIASYVEELSIRSPAGNMAYFIYSENGYVDYALYVAFWPIYKAHHLLIGGVRHNLDRPD